MKLNGYQVFTKVRKKKRGAKRNSGGLCVFVKDIIADFFELIDWANNEDGLILKINCSFTALNKDLYFLFVYMRPSSSTRNNLLQENDCIDLLHDKNRRS